MLSNLISKIITTEKYSLQSIFTEGGKIYTFLNPVSYLSALNYKHLFAQFDGILVDGSILAAAIKILYGKTITRRSFDMTSLAPKLLKYAEKNRKTVYIVGSQEEEIKKAILVFKEKYPDLLLIGYRNGYFSSDIEMDKEAEQISRINPDFLIVGMGTIMQERFLLNVKRKGFLGIGFTCGGFIHQTSKNEIEYYPPWINKLNLRFVYRFYKEKHTRKRYIQAGFLFPIRFLFERLFG